MSRFAQERTRSRRSNYRATFDKEDSKKHRLTNAVNIRKNKREESLLKRRNFGVAGDDFSSASEIEEQRKLLPQMAQKVLSDNPAYQLEGTTGIRKLLSIENNPPIDEVIKCGVISTLISFLDVSKNNSQLQFEAAWALTNIASGNSQQTLTLLQKGAVPAFVSLLTNNDIQVREQAVWALGNIAGDSHQCRDYILGFNILPILLEMTRDDTKNSLQRNATWTISNLCRGKPAPNFDVVRTALPDLARLIHGNDDEQILVDACWALSYLSDGDNEKIKAVMKENVARRVVELLMHVSHAVQTPALRVVGNIVTGDDLHTQIVLNCQVLPLLKRLLKSLKKGIRKEVCWTISNITAGTPIQIQAVIGAGLIPDLIDQLNHAEFDIKKEAAWAIANATSSGTHQQIDQLVELGCIEPMCKLLQAPDSRIVGVALEALENILECGEEKKGNEEENPYAQLIDEVGGVDSIEYLQHHENQQIFEKCSKIIEKYFQIEDEEQETNPNITADALSFSFNSQPTPNGGFSF